MQKSDTFFVLFFSFHFLYCSDLFCWLEPQGPRSTVVGMACLFFPCLTGNVSKGDFG